MKKTILIWLSLLPFLSAAQTVNVPTTEYVDRQIRAVNMRIDSLIKSGGVTPPPTPALDSCKRGPIIVSISKVTNTGATLLFDAFDVPGINYVILSEAGNMLYSDSLVNLTTNNVPFRYSYLVDGSYYLRISGRTCVSKPSQRKFTVRSDLPPPLPSNSKVRGAEEIKVDGRYFTYNQTPELVLSFNADGSISDATPELDNSGPISKWRGWNVFYMKGYYYHENPDGSYAKFQNITLPDGPHSIRQFICNPDKIPTFEHFKKYLTDNGDRGVTEVNAKMSQSFVTIRSDSKVGQGIGNNWLVVSRTLNFPSALPAMDWKPYYKFFAFAYINRGDDQATYQRVGAIPYVRVGSPIYQGHTWNTIKVEHGRVLSADEAYATGRQWSGFMGSSPYSYMTDEIPENAQGKDPDDYETTRQVARGEYEDVREKTGITDKRKMGIYGSYGGDDFHGLLNINLFFGNRADYEHSLTDKLYKGYGRRPDGNFGFSDENHAYFAKNHIGVRNINSKYYFWNRVFYLPYEFLYLKEKVALATKTYGGIDRESGLSIFSTDIVESFVMNDKGEKINVEENSSGELIEYPNGTMLTRMNTQPPAPFDEMFTASFWAHILVNGITVWDAPGANFGKDSTKIDVFSDQWFAWRPKGQNNFQRYQSGVDGAPINSQEGLKNTLWAPVVDAAAAGMEAAYQIKDRIATISYISYKSSRGEFIAQPGLAGYHVNGFGVPNYRSFALRDAFDQKKGLSLVGEGPAGVVLIYYNGFLSAHLYEDVKIRYAGVEYDLGRVYGRQTVIKKL